MRPCGRVGTMRIARRDFIPNVVEARIVRDDKLETVEDLIQRANRWIASSGVRVIDVETVLLPHETSESGAQEPGINISGTLGGQFKQSIRVWYEDVIETPG